MKRRLKRRQRMKVSVLFITGLGYYLLINELIFLFMHLVSRRKISKIFLISVLLCPYVAVEIFCYFYFNLE